MGRPDYRKQRRKAILVTTRSRERVSPAMKSLFGTLLGQYPDMVRLVGAEPESSHQRALTAGQMRAEDLKTQ